jgi:hypothetical protein
MKELISQEMITDISIQKYKKHQLQESLLVKQDITKMIVKSKKMDLLREEKLELLLVRHWEAQTVLN